MRYSAQSEQQQHRGDIHHKVTHHKEVHAAPGTQAGRARSCPRDTRGQTVEVIIRSKDSCAVRAVQVQHGVVEHVIGMAYAQCRSDDVRRTAEN
jgi:hypothetical protein